MAKKKIKKIQCVIEKSTNLHSKNILRIMFYFKKRKKS